MCHLKTLVNTEGKKLVRQCSGKSNNIEHFYVHSKHARYIFIYSFDSLNCARSYKNPLYFLSYMLIYMDLLEFGYTLLVHIHMLYYNTFFSS